MPLEDTRPHVHLEAPLDNDSSVGTQLAYLVARIIQEYPQTDIPSIRLSITPGPDGWPYAAADARLGTITGECPSCHTHDGHPHTDYCQLNPT